MSNYEKIESLLKKGKLVGAINPDKWEYNVIVFLWIKSNWFVISTKYGYGEQQCINNIIPEWWILSNIMQIDENWINNENLVSIKPFILW